MLGLFDLTFWFLVIYYVLCINQVPYGKHSLFCYQVVVNIPGQVICCHNLNTKENTFTYGNLNMQCLIGAGFKYYSCLEVDYYKAEFLKRAEESSRSHQMRDHSKWEGCSFMLIIILCFQAQETCITLSAAKIPLCLCQLIKKYKSVIFPVGKGFFVKAFKLHTKI